jgi:hypothetical protein
VKVFIGFDPREQNAYQVASASLRKHSSISVDVRPLVLEQLRWQKVYNRPTEIRENRLHDVISNAPMSTEFALTRFAIPALTDGWALFCDCDVLFRADIAELLKLADDKYAVMVVPHAHQPTESTKMDGQKQTSYARKNWSSFVLWNCDHLKHVGQVDRLNKWPGLWLHQFKWLEDSDIGFLPAAWNVLEGEDDHKVFHMTRGTPDMPGYEAIRYAMEWRSYLPPSA